MDNRVADAIYCSVCYRELTNVELRLNSGVPASRGQRNGLYYVWHWPRIVQKSFGRLGRRLANKPP
jgi:hypothetical protein